MLEKNYFSKIFKKNKTRKKIFNFNLKKIKSKNEQASKSIRNK
jgi:hypothetical protein